MPPGQRSGRVRGKPGVLSDELGLFFLTCLLMQKPGPGHLVRGGQQVGREAFWWGGQPEGRARPLGVI